MELLTILILGALFMWIGLPILNFIRKVFINGVALVIYGFIIYTFACVVVACLFYPGFLIAILLGLGVLVSLAGKRKRQVPYTHILDEK